MGYRRIYKHIFQRFCNHEGQKKFAQRFRGDFVFGKNLLAFFETSIEIWAFSGLPLFFIKNFSKTKPPIGWFKALIMPKSWSKTFQKFIYCPNHHYIHLQKSPRKFHT